MKNSAETLEKRNALRHHWRKTLDLDSFPHEIVRKCRDCKEDRPCKWMSSFTQTGKPEYRVRCNDCHNQYLSRLRKRNRPRVTTQALDRRFLVKQKCVEYLGGRCRRCGYQRCVKAMTFHHRDPTQKSFDISQRLDRAWNTLVEELDKCDLLCSNCHNEEHCNRDRDIRSALSEPSKNNCEGHGGDDEQDHRSAVQLGQ